ncbi:hypothetical protein HP532_20480 [Pseudomonas sp. CrR25]|nr:hypothetical protein [Pseudomonas sp. CrR25]
MSMLTVATTQFACSWDLDRNLDQAEQLVRQAAAQGAQVILLQELFATPYFCIEQDHKHLALAEEYGNGPVLKRFAALARELGVVLPLSWFEKAGNAYFNSLAVADADGRLLGVYRKTHIPNAIGYQEKEYFSPGDTGFRVWETAFGRLGLGICWDQWFPETARCLAPMGAEVLLFPTAIANFTGYPTANARARAAVDPQMRDNPDLYPDEARYARLIPGKDIPQRDMRARMRTWTNFKTATAH